jgi:hypothetical protein
MPESSERAGHDGVLGLLNKIANPAMRMVLRSPLHGLVSGSTMLVTVKGRKSGKAYTTPVNYVREGDSITIFSLRSRTWWRNLRGGAPIALRVRGRDLRGSGEVTATDVESVGAALLAMRPQLSPSRASRLARDGVIISISLDEGDA